MDVRNYRLAFIESFKRRGIYPKDINILSVDSLRYPEIDNTPKLRSSLGKLNQFLKDYARKMTFQTDRKKIFQITKSHIAGDRNQEGLHKMIRQQKSYNEQFEQLTGIMITENFKEYGINEASYGQEYPSFFITNLRLVNRIGPTGKKVNHIIFTILQTARLDFAQKNNPVGSELTAWNKEDDSDADIKFRGGATIIFDVDTRELKYSIAKPIFDRFDSTKLDQTRFEPANSISVRPSNEWIIRTRTIFQFDPQFLLYLSHLHYCITTKPNTMSQKIERCTIRMYTMGTGDCFLLFFKNGHDEVLFKMLI